MKKLLVLTLYLSFSMGEHVKGGERRKKESELESYEEHDEYGGFEGDGHEDIKEQKFDGYSFGRGNIGLNFFQQEPEVHEVTKVVPVHKTIKVPEPHPVQKNIHVPVPVKELEPYPIHIPVPVVVEKVIQVPVEKIVEYPVEKLVPVKVVKKVRVPVPKPYPVPVPVYKTKYVYHIKKYHHE